MDPARFGVQLLLHRDLDPTYYPIRAIAQRDRGLAKRLFLAHLLFYDLGTAARIVDDADDEPFWTTVRRYAASLAHRGSERRHFRGELADAAINWMASQYPTPEWFFNFSEWSGETTASQIFAHLSYVPQFGDYFKFKYADVMERCFGQNIKFDINLLDLYKSPREAATLFAFAARKHEPQAVIDHLLNVLSAYPAPPGDDRPCNIQEVETVLCVAKAAYTGSDYIGRGIGNLRRSLERAGCPLARELLTYVPPTPPTEIQNGWFFNGNRP